MTQIPEKIPQQVETSALDGQEFSELDTLIVDFGSIGCTFARKTRAFPNYKISEI